MYEYFLKSIFFIAVSTHKKSTTHFRWLSHCSLTGHYGRIHMALFQASVFSLLVTLSWWCHALLKWILFSYATHGESQEKFNFWSASMAVSQLNFLCKYPESMNWPVCLFFYRSNWSLQWIIKLLDINKVSNKH